MRSVISSGTSPSDELYLTPKSPSMPPGLWLAERIIRRRPPCLADHAGDRGVERIPPFATSDPAEPFAAAIRRITAWIASRLK